MFRLKLHEEALKKGETNNRKATNLQNEKKKQFKKQEKILERLHQEISHLKAKVFLISLKLIEKN